MCITFVVQNAVNGTFNHMSIIPKRKLDGDFTNPKYDRFNSIVGQITVIALLLAFVGLLVLTLKG